jgi:hypothetical protein
MRTIKLTTGAEVPLDGDLMTVIESLYLEITAKRELERTFEDTVKEIQEIIDQMTDDERRQYLSESLFLNFVSFENDGAALRRPPGVRLRRPLRPARARRRASGHGDGGLDGRDRGAPAPRSERRRLELLRGLSAQAAAQER